VLGEQVEERADPVSFLGGVPEQVVREEQVTIGNPPGIPGSHAAAGRARTAEPGARRPGGRRLREHPDPRRRPVHPGRRRSAVRPAHPGSGLLIFASVLLLVTGVVNLVGGIAAISGAQILIASAHSVSGGLRAWGWVMAVLGAAQLVAAAGVWAGSWPDGWP